jgi:hypothetical protein
MGEPRTMVQRTLRLDAVDVQVIRHECTHKRHLWRGYETSIPRLTH